MIISSNIKHLFKNPILHNLKSVLIILNKKIDFYIHLMPNHFFIIKNKCIKCLSFSNLIDLNLKNLVVD